MVNEDHRDIYDRLRVMEREQAVQGEQIKQLVESARALEATIKPLAEALNRGRGFAAAFWLLWSIVPAAAGAMIGYWLRGGA